MTPLFPKDNEQISLRQGQTDDCYLLASLDCIFNTPECRAKVKSMFSETKDNFVLRIKRRGIGAHLQLDKVIKKYKYHYDKKTGEDVFTISKERANKIDSSTRGVKSNSLAVKLLERISSYYFVKNWSSKTAQASLMAHSLDDGLDRHGMDDTSFVSQLVGVECEQFSDFHKIIKLKDILPDYPIYISISWGGFIHGREHPRHALRIKSIIPVSKNSNDYTFVLVNPWDNSKEERYTLTELKRKSPYFSIFAANRNEMEFTKIVLALSNDEAKLLVSTPQLLRFTKQIKTVQVLISATDVKNIIAIYKVMPELATLYEKLTREEKLILYRASSQAKGNKNDFINEFLSKVQRVEVVREVVSMGLPPESISTVVDVCLKAKDEGLYSFLYKVDMFAQLLHTKLDQEVFLQNLIALETAQTLPNYKRLKIIASYVESYNSVNTSAPLTVTVDKRLIAGVHLKTAEVALLNAQCLYLRYLQEVKNLPVLFLGSSTEVEVETEYDRLLGILQRSDTDFRLKSALQALSSRDVSQLEEAIKIKKSEIKAAAAKQIKLMHQAQEKIESFVHQLNFKVSYDNAKSLTEIEQQKGNYKSFLNKLKTNDELIHAQAILGGLDSEIQKQLKLKDIEIEELAWQREKHLSRAQLEIGRAIQSIEDFSPSFAGLYSANKVRAFYSAHIRILKSLRDAPPVAEAHSVLGLSSYHPLLVDAFQEKYVEITRVVDALLGKFSLVQGIVRAYEDSIKAIGADFSTALTEKAIKDRAVSLSSKLENLKVALQKDERFTECLEAKEGVKEIIDAQMDAIAQAGINAHNRLMILQLNTVINNSKFTDHYNSLVALDTKKAKEMATAKELCRRIGLAKEELLESPIATKLTTSLMTTRLSRFKTLVLAALSDAENTLGNAYKWQDKLDNLKLSVANLQDLLMMYSTPNRHSMFRTVSPDRKPYLSAKELIYAA